MPAVQGQISSRDLLKTYSGRYQPPQVLWGSSGYWLYRDKPPFRRFWHVPAMIADPRITMALLTIKGALTSLARFYIDESYCNDGDYEAPDSEIKQFAVKQITRWWRNSVSFMLEAMEWGWTGGEPLYRVQKDGKIGFDKIRWFESRDIYPVTKNGEFVGLELRPRGAGGHGMFLGGEKAFWHVHWRNRHRWWGWSRLFGAYEPWLDLHSEGGGIDIRRKWYYKHAYQGKRLYHPPGTYIDDQGKRIPWKEIARSLVEQERAGGIFVFDSIYHEGTKNPLWKIEDPPSSGDGGLDVREYIYDLKREIVEGLGVSEELFRAAETGSGYSGRSIPEKAFRGILTDIVQWMIVDFDEQILRPLIRRNFGEEPEYEIQVFGLVEQEDEVRAMTTGNGAVVPNESAQKAKAASAV